MSYNADFEAWLLDFVRPGEPHAILPGRQVHLAALPHPHGLSADQAVALARRLLDCAAKEGEPIMLFADGRQPTKNERHLCNLLSWREREAVGLRAHIGRLAYELDFQHAECERLKGAK